MLKVYVQEGSSIGYSYYNRFVIGDNTTKYKMIVNEY